jgi:hypothetical protein
MYSQRRAPAVTMRELDLDLKVGPATQVLLSSRRSQNDLGGLEPGTSQVPSPLDQVE